MGSILSLRRVSGWKTEENEAQRPISLNLTRPSSTLFERILRERLYSILKGIWRRTLSFPISLYRCLKGVFHRIKPRITAGPLLPLENSTPKPSDLPPLKQGLLISDSDGVRECPNIHVFADQYLEQNQEYSCETKNTEDSVTISVPGFGSHSLASYSTSSITDSAGICISTEKKYLESSEEKESEVEKVVKSAVLVVEKAIWIKHYSSRQRILLVGEGDFSFSYSLAAAFGCASKMIATSLDSSAFLKKNYAKAPWNIAELKKRGCTVMHGIDATTLATQKLLQHKTFDRIIFNFPFAGFFKGLSRDSSLRLHRRLVSLFLKNAKEMIDVNGEIHISHKTNGYHNEWYLVSIASSHGLRLIQEVEFDLSDYPGYNTKRGFGGDENFNCYPSSTFKFGLKFVGHGMLDNLLRIGLKSSKSKDCPLKALGRLPNLMDIRLVDGFEGDKLEFVASSFEKLKIIVIESCSRLNTIVIEEGAIPELQKMNLRRCPNLKMLPLGIHNLIFQRLKS